MALLWIADSFYVGVKDIAASASWYMDKLGCTKTLVELDDCENCVALHFPKERGDISIVIGPVSNVADLTTRMLYSGAIEKAHQSLNFRGVAVGPITTDRQGTRYFSMRDLEGNQIEVSEEP